ncbi:MAG: PAS domain S-box protein [Anaerolineae bacterium]|nr:PAS domain S-box protein [Anaerolineae bacterium]
MEALNNWHNLLSQPQQVTTPPPRTYPLIVRCGLAIGFTLIGLLVTAVFEESFSKTPFLLVWITTALNFLMFRTLPGYISGVLGIVLTQYFVVNDQRFGFGNAEVLQAVVFFATFAFINELIVRQRKAELAVVNGYNDRLLERLDILRAVTDAMPVFVWICDPNKHCTYFNRAWTDFTGRDMKQELGFGWVDRIHPEDLQKCKAIYNQAFVEIGKFALEFRLRRADGIYRWVLDEGVPLRAPNGQFMGYVGTCTDITERKEQESRLQAVLTHMPVMLSVYNAEGQRIVWNKECERVTGYTAEEICYNPNQLELLYPNPEYRASMMAYQEANRGNFRDWELETTCKDGSIRYILWSNVSKQYPISDWVDWAVGVDVTERRLIEDALRQTEANFSVALKNSPIVVSHIDTDQRYTWIYNPPLGITTGDLIGKRDEDVWPYESMINFINFKEEVLRTGKGGRREVEFRGESTYMAYDITAEPIFDDNGVIIGLTLASLDITERKQVEHQQAELMRQQTELMEHERIARAKAEEADRLKIDFLAMISHELRTPLTAIKGFATTLLADDVTWDTAAQHEFLSIISEDSDRLTDLIEQLLDLSRLEAGRFSIEPGLFQLSDCLTSIIGQLHVLAEEHELSLDFPPDLPTVWADRMRTGQILVNLVDNAAKYAPSGTQISIVASHIDSWVQVEITDQGPGIPAEKRGVVFEAFRQLESKFAHPGKGAGLGLAICKRLVEAQGGNIWIGDMDMPGTKVVFTLPVAREDLKINSVSVQN